MIVPIMVIAGGLLLGVASPASAQTPAPNQVGVVVMHGSGQIVTRCVEFAEPELSGLAVLQRSGLDLSFDASGLGGAVCRLDNEGCAVPEQSCFCQCEGGACAYWSYWKAGGSAWQYSNIGAGNATVKPGEVEGWVWGPGSVDSAPSPPSIAFADICAAPTAPALTPTPTSTSTMAPTLPVTPTPTTTASPTASFTPLATLAPVAAPAPPVIEFFAADRTNLIAGESAILRWRVSNAASVVLRAGNQALAVDAAGELLLAPPASAALVLEASNNSGSVTASVTLVVAPPAAAAFGATAPTLTPVQPISAPMAAMPTPIPPTPIPPAPVSPTPVSPTPVPPTTALPAPVSAPPSETKATALSAVILLPVVMVNDAVPAATIVTGNAPAPAPATAVPVVAVAAVKLPPIVTPEVTGLLPPIITPEAATVLVTPPNVWSTAAPLPVLVVGVGLLVAMPFGLMGVVYLAWMIWRKH